MIWGYLRIHPEFGRVLVVCPSCMKLKWKEEIDKWTDRDFELLWGERPTPLRENREDQINIIINYDILFHWMDELLKVEWDLVIGDEGQCVSNYSAKRTKAFIKIAKKSERIIFLTGTPIRNYPKDFFTMLNLVDPEDFANRWSYLQRYCGPKFNGFGWTFKGATRVEELRRLVNPLLLRRRKSEVLKELPEKVRTVVPMEKDVSYLADYDEESRSIREWLVGSEEKLNYVEVKKKLDGLKSKVYFVKRRSVINWIKDFLSTGEKLVVFAYHRKVIDDLMAQFGDVAVKVDGSVSARERQRAIESFQSSFEVKLFIGQ